MDGDKPARPGSGDGALTVEQALAVFKLYEDKGWAVKQQMLTLITWLTPIVFALIAFCARDYLSNKVSVTTTVAGWTSLALSCFMFFLVVLSLLHANRDYARAHRVLDHARDRELHWENIFSIILDEQRLYPSTGFHYIGWQFILVMVFSLLLVLITWPLAIYIR